MRLRKMPAPTSQAARALMAHPLYSQRVPCRTEARSALVLSFRKSRRTVSAGALGQELVKELALFLEACQLTGQPLDFRLQEADALGHQVAGLPDAALLQPRCKCPPELRVEDDREDRDEQDEEEDE